MKKIEDVYEIKYKSINLGKYIYQSYLRDYNQPTINLNDLRLKEVIKKSFLIYFNVHEYFSKNKVKIVIPSHTVYLYYGIITEYAFKKGCKVFRIKQSGYRDSTSTDLIKVDNKLAESPPTHNYKKIFDNFNFKNKKLYRNIGRKHLLDRFHGKMELNLSGKIIIYHKKKINLNSILKKKKFYYFYLVFLMDQGGMKILYFLIFINGYYLCWIMLKIHRMIGILNHILLD